MKEDEKAPRKSWDLMIGITLVIFGFFRLYNQFQEAMEINFRILVTCLFIIYGGYLIFRHFYTNDEEDSR